MANDGVCMYRDLMFESYSFLKRHIITVVSYPIIYNLNLPMSKVWANLYWGVFSKITDQYFSKHIKVKKRQGKTVKLSLIEDAGETWQVNTIRVLD